MPIEIREMIIRTTVGPQAMEQDVSGQDAAEDRQTLIQECVDQVMEILREKAERYY